MITACAHDGALYDDSLISTHGFALNHKRDTKEAAVYDPSTGEKTDKTETTFNFVGFVSNDDDDLLVVFPKHYNILNEENDSRIVFDCIARHMQKRPELYIGEERDEIFESNFPFAAFFGIYNYYAAYGLYFEDRTFIKPNAGGRINWKETISRCDKFLINGRIELYPLYYRKNFHLTNYITECMIYAIDYTISKFGILMDAEPTGQAFPEMNLLEEREYVIGILQQLRQQTFRDNEQMLIDNLIEFFMEINVGGRYYLKHYAFSSVWEDMVTEYLCKYYREINARHELVFDKAAPSHLKFEKKSFHTNSAKPSQYISPDHYCEDGSTQLIFDAKYYTAVNGMDYKQIAYMFILREMQDPVTGTAKFTNTYSALILPAEARSTKIHFQIDPLYSSCHDFRITEEYLDIRDVIEEYIV